MTHTSALGKQIVIVGPGALGTLFAVRLARAGAAVTILDHREHRAAAIRRDGLQLLAPDGPGRSAVEGLLSARVAVETSAARLPAADFILLAVKCTSLADAGRALRDLPAPATILTIQNGLGIIVALRAALGPAAATHRLIAAVTYQAAHRAPDGLVHQVASLPTFIDAGPAVRDAARSIAAILVSAGLPASLEPDLRPALWRKLIVNVSINALTALEGVSNGALVAIEPLRRRMLVLAQEAARAARADGAAITDDEAEQAALAAAASTARNISSMRQDLDAGRPTEIEFLNGAVLRLAEAHGLDLPEMRTLTDAVRAAAELRE